MREIMVRVFPRPMSSAAFRKTNKGHLLTFIREKKKNLLKVSNTETHQILTECLECFWQQWHKLFRTVLTYLPTHSEMQRTYPECLHRVFEFLSTAATPTLSSDGPGATPGQPVRTQQRQTQNAGKKSRDWDSFIPWLECLNLKASGVWRLSFSTGAGFQRPVEMVNGLTGGIFHSQETVFSHPTTIKGLDLWACYKDIKIYLIEEKIIIIKKWKYQWSNLAPFPCSAYLQTSERIPGSSGAPHRCWRPAGRDLKREHLGVGWCHLAGWVG